jgi:hypothetical protein
VALPVETVKAQSGELSLSFDGIDDYVEVPLGDFPAGGPLTLEYWATVEEPHPDPANRDMHVAQLATPERVVEFSIWDGLLKTIYRDPGRQFPLAGLQNVLGKHHVAVVWDGEQWSQFVDGKLIGRTNEPGEEPWHFAGITPTLVFGALGPTDGDLIAFVEANHGHLFHGSLHAFRVTEAVVYADEFTPPEQFELTPETLTLFDFTRDTGHTLIDLSPQAHNGTIHGATWTREPLPD